MSTDETIEPLEDDLPEQMRIRQEKRARLIESGKAAYPVTVLTRSAISARRTRTSLPVPRPAKSSALPVG